jgi:hypothetical protein
VKSAKLFLIGSDLLVAVAAVAGVLSFTRDHPRVAATAASILALLFVLSWREDRRNRRFMARAESILAGLSCPQCGGCYGSDVAFAALHPPRPANVKYMLDRKDGVSS